MISAALTPEPTAPSTTRGGLSFAAALCGFLCTTVATTMLLVLIGTL